MYTQSLQMVSSLLIIRQSSVNISHLSMFSTYSAYLIPLDFIILPIFDL
jgi:hypothetical protein